MMQIFMKINDLLYFSEILGLLAVILSFTTPLMLRVDTLSIPFLEVLINFNGVFLAVMYMV